MRDTKELIEFLDEKLELSVKGLAFAEEIKPNQDNVNYWKDEISILTEIKQILEQQAQVDDDLVEKIMRAVNPIGQSGWIRLETEIRKLLQATP